MFFWKTWISSRENILEAKKLQTQLKNAKHLREENPITKACLDIPLFVVCCDGLFFFRKKHSHFHCWIFLLSSKTWEHRRLFFNGHCGKSIKSQKSKPNAKTSNCLNCFHSRRTLKNFSLSTVFADQKYGFQFDRGY